MEPDSVSTSPDTQIINQTEYEDKILVHYWRYALEGVIIPCVSLPGIMGGLFFLPQSSITSISVEILRVRS